MTHKDKSIHALHRLGELSKKHNITQADLAQLLGIRQQTVSQIFVGRFHPTLDNVIRYIDAINELAGTSYSLKDIDE